MKDQVISLFNALAFRFGRSAVLYHVEDQIDVAPIVVEEWIDGKRDPSSGIQKAILNCLKNIRPDDFPQERQPKKIALKIAKPSPPSNDASPKTARRESVIKQNEEAFRALAAKLRREGLILGEVE